MLILHLEVCSKAVAPFEIYKNKRQFLPKPSPKRAYNLYLAFNNSTYYFFHIYYISG